MVGVTVGSLKISCELFFPLYIRARLVYVPLYVRARLMYVLVD